MVGLGAHALSFSKDCYVSPFECALMPLEPTCEQLSVSERMELVFADMDMVHLLVQENYLNHRPAIAPDGASRFRAIAKAADSNYSNYSNYSNSISFSFSLCDVLRRSQNWGLMPFEGVMTVMTVMTPPCLWRRGDHPTLYHTTEGR